MRRAQLSMLAVMVGCSAVPDVRYVDPGDAGADAPRDAARDSPADAANGCTRIEATDICCDSTTCRGDCTAANCTECTTKCRVDELCCAKNNNVLCKARSSPSCN